ncbi:MAG: hypothetical protein C0177_04000, partial [Fervidicoccus fontis]
QNSLSRQISLVEKKLPLLASGKLGANYELIFKYWEIAKRESPEKEKDVVLSTDDLDYAEKLIREKKTRLKVSEIIDELVAKIINRIDSGIALKAYESVYGIKTDPFSARKEVATVVALWILEALENEGKLVLS